MGVYIFIIFMIIILNYIIRPYKNKRKSRNYLFCIYFILMLFLCTRTYRVGADTIQYYRDFFRISTHSLKWSINNLRYEAGFISLCKVLSFISKDAQILIAFSSLIIFYSVFSFIYANSESPCVSLLIFIFLNSFFMYITAMRQALAISVILYGYELFYKKNKYIKYFITVLVASLFHSSAIAMLLLLVIPKKIEYTKVLLIFVVLASVICFIAPEKIFSIITIESKYANYESSSYYEGGSVAGYLNYFLCFANLLFSFFYKLDFKKDKDINFNLFNNYLYIVSANLIFYALAAKISIVTRVTTYLDIFNCIYLSMAINNIKSFNSKKIILSLFWITLFAHWIIVALFRPEWYGAIPYESILFRSN